MRGLVGALTTPWQLTVYFLAFSLPVLLPHPQWLTGTIVNALFFLAAPRLTQKQLLPLLLLPSLGAVTQGILFGPQTVFLYYFLPFIWLGNFVLTQAFTRIKGSYITRVVVAAMAKYLLLTLAVRVYFQASLVPALFLTAMGSLQLITALAGGVIAGVYERTRAAD